MAETRMNRIAARFVVCGVRRSCVGWPNTPGGALCLNELWVCRHIRSLYMLPSS